VKWFRRVLTLVIIVGLGWLYLSAPGIRLDTTNDVIACQPLGFQTPKDVVLLAYPIDTEETIEKYLEESAFIDASDPNSRPEQLERAKADVASLCQDARQDRAATLTVALAAALGLLVWWRTRRPRLEPADSTRTSDASQKEI